MIELLEGFPENVLAFAGRSRVTRQDYETVLVPAIGSARKIHDTVRLYYELGGAFGAGDAAAVLEDIRMGIGSPDEWERIALVCDADWIGRIEQTIGPLAPGHAMVFDSSTVLAARAWIVAARAR